MIIQAVLLFAFLSSLFELVILMKIKPRTRLRVLGSKRWPIFIHVITFSVNIFVHYGTVTGTMTAIVASLASFVTVPIARKISGSITKLNNKEEYNQGLITYTYQQIA